VDRSEKLVETATLKEVPIMLNLRRAAIPSDEDLIRWSLDNPGYRFEYVNGEITIVSPTGDSQ
jgi:Uma2 family endonuclease